MAENNNPPNDPYGIYDLDGMKGSFSGPDSQSQFGNEHEDEFDDPAYIDPDEETDDSDEGTGDDDSGAKSKIKSDKGADSASFFQHLASDDTDSNLRPLETDDERNARIDSLRNGMKAAVQGFKIPDAIARADDVDFNDPTSRVAWMENVGREVMKGAINAIMPVMDSMLVAAANSLGHYANQRIAASKTTTNNANFLEAAIPIMASKQHKGMVTTMFQEALTRYNGNRDKAVNSVKKGLRGLGIDYMKVPGAKPDEQSPSGRRQGTDALDQFAPMRGAESVKSRMQV